MEQIETNNKRGTPWNGALLPLVRITVGLLLTSGVASIIFYAGAYWQTGREIPTGVEFNRQTTIDNAKDLAVMKIKQENMQKELDKLEQQLHGYIEKCRSGP